MAGLSQPIKTGPCFSDQNAFFLPRKHGKHGIYPHSVISIFATLHPIASYQIEMTMLMIKSFLPILPYILQLF